MEHLGPHMHGRPKLLVVDDQPLNIRLLHELFRSECEVHMAIGGQQALSIATALLPDLILLDIIMPEIDGYEVCRQLKSNSITQDIPVIFITGRSHEDDEAKGFEMGAVDYIHKPFNTNVVYARVMNHVKLKVRDDYLRTLVMLDGLTGILNRRGFDELFTSSRAQAQRDSTPLTLLMVDVDYFKRYNDLHGHLRGDQCLREVAKVLSKSIRRPHDQVARFGGEEFVVLLPNTDATGALQVAQSIQAAISALAIEHGASSVGNLVTLSIGAATHVPGRGSSSEQHLSWADEQLYRAKREGRNQICSGTYPSVQAP